VHIPDPPNADRRYWDGGVAAYNNPVLAAVTEALANGVPAARIDVLSIGTASTMRPRADATVGAPLAKPDAHPGPIRDLVKLTGAILDEPPDAATFIAHVALGIRMPAGPHDPVADGALVRMNPVIRPVRIDGAWALPPGSGFSLQEFETLAGLDSDAVAPREVALIDRFAQRWLADLFPNQPIRAGRDFAVEIGHATFSEAARAWRKLEGR
jgi:hypothetical protein